MSNPSLYTTLAPSPPPVRSQPPTSAPPSAPRQRGPDRTCLGRKRKVGCLFSIGCTHDTCLVLLKPPCPSLCTATLAPILAALLAQTFALRSGSADLFTSVSHKSGETETGPLTEIRLLKMDRCSRWFLAGAAGSCWEGWGAQDYQQCSRRSRGVQSWCV